MGVLPILGDVLFFYGNYFISTGITFISWGLNQNKAICGGFIFFGGYVWVGWV